MMNIYGSYGDGVVDINIVELVAFQQHGLHTIPVKPFTRSAY